jgi:hypothetical protein
MALDLGVVAAVGVTVALFCPQAAGAGAGTGAAATDAGTAVATPFVLAAGAAAPCGPHAVVTGAGRQAEPEKAAGTVGVTEPLFAVAAAVPSAAVPPVLATTGPGANGGKATCAGSPKGVSLSSPG